MNEPWLDFADPEEGTEAAPWQDFEPVVEQAPAGALPIPQLPVQATLPQALAQPVQSLQPWQGGVVRSVLPGVLQPEQLVPAIRLIGGEVVPGEPGDTHPDIIREEGIPAVEIDQRGFRGPGGSFLDREAAAQATLLPTNREPGRLHSTDLIDFEKAELPPELEVLAPSKQFPGIGLSPYQRAEILAGHKVETGMEPGTELTTALATEGGKLLAPIERGLQYAGNVVRAIPADIAETAAGNEKYYDMLNLGAAAIGEPLPIDEKLNEAASDSKTWATVGKISQGIAATAPMAIIGAAPAAIQKFVLAGFTAKMMSDTPELARQLGDELGKPKDQQDPGRISDLVSAGIQNVGFTLAGTVALRRSLAPERAAAVITPTPEMAALAPAEVLYQTGAKPLSKMPPILAPAPYSGQLPPPADRQTLTKGLEYASRLREDARQVPPAGVEPVRSEVKGEPDLEQPAPGQPSGAAPGRQPAQAQAQQARVLLTPEGLTPEADRYLQLEREALDDPNSVVVGAEHMDEGQPFAEGQIASISRDTGKIVLNAPELNALVADMQRRGATDSQIRQKVRSVLHEEAVHHATTEAMARRWMKYSTALENALETYLYTGEWTLEAASKKWGREFTQRDIAYEAIRRRIQRLADIPTSEVAEMLGVEKWKLQTVEVLNDIVFDLRKALGTKASKIQLRMLDRVQKNLDVARDFITKFKGLPAWKPQSPKILLKGADGKTIPAYSEGWGPGRVVDPVTGKESLGNVLWVSRLTEGGDGWTTGPIREGETVVAGKVQPKPGETTPTGGGKIALPGFQGKRPAAIRVGERTQESRAMDVLDDFFRNNRRGRELLESGIHYGDDMEQVVSSEAHEFLSGALTYSPKDPIGYFERRAKDYGHGPEVEAAMLRISGMLNRYQPKPEVRKAIDDWIDKQLGKREKGRVLATARDSMREGYEAERQADRARWEQLTQEISQPKTAEERFAMQDKFREMEAIKNKYGGFPPPPAALRRASKGEPQPELFLPPLPKGQVVERGGFPLPSPRVVGQVADAHFADLAKAPSFERFQGELQSQFGSGITREQLYQQWQDAMFRRLVTAKGTEIDALLDKLNLRGKVATALKPGEAEPMLGRGRIPDPLEMPGAQMSLAEVEKFFAKSKWTTKSIYRQKFGPEQRRRYAAISEIADTLMQQAGPAPKKGWSRTKIGPEDITQTMVVVNPAKRMIDPETGLEDFSPPDIVTKPGWRTLTPEEAADAVKVGTLAVRGARITGQKVSLSKNVLTLRRNSDGKLILVSAFMDGRRGPKVTNPEGASLEAKNIDADLLKKYTPTVLMRLREPVDRFRQVFDSQEAFDNEFQDVGIEGTPGLKTSSFTGPEAGTARAQAGLTGPSKPPPEAEIPPRPPAITEPTGARELVTPGRARPIPGRMPLARYPQKYPLPPGIEMLPRGAMRPLQAEVPVEIAPKLPYETLPRPSTPRPITEIGKPQPVQPGTYYRESVARKRAVRAPAALRRSPIADEAKAIQKNLGRLMAGFETTDKVTRLSDSAGNTANNLAMQAENRVRFASAMRPPGLLQRAAGRWQRGNKDVLAAANVLVEAKAVRADGSIDNYKRGQIPIFRQYVAEGMRKAQDLVHTGNWAERRIGRAWIRNQENLGRELDYAEAHWNDPELRETAKRVSEAYRDQIDYERSKGFDVTKKPGYDPHRYDAALWNGDSFLFELSSYTKKIMGRRFRESQLFPSYYHASKAGPYLAVTRDAASLVGHRVRQGLNMVMQNEWKDGLKNIRLADGRPLAIEPVAGAHRRWLSPESDYSVVPGANHLAVQNDFVPLVRLLTDPSHVELFGPTRALLHLSQAIKHSILVGDFFHLGRMLYYATAVMGRKAGFKSGWTVLDIAPRDMPEAVAKGIIRQKDADWANTPVSFGRGGTITRQQLAQKFYRQMGANLGRVQDALYKDILTELTPTAGKLRRGIVRVIDPSVGRYNRFLFDRLTRGFMAEAVVREFERQSKANPGASPHALMRDIARDVNNFFGNIGQQGWFKSKTWQDAMRIFWLAPQWVEGLVKKEAISAWRLTGAAKLSGLRKAPTTLGTTGRAIGQGMLFMLGVTQALNLIFRKQPTWKNEEEGHKWDAWIPGWGAESEGFWLSPLAIYNEISHDLYRLFVSKPTLADAISQIAGNKMQPVARALMVAIMGTDPMGRKLTTTAGRYGTAAKQLVPVPITFGKALQAGGHAVAPGLVSPPPPGAVQRQAAATLGIKIEPNETAVQQVAKLAKGYMEREGLTKETGWQQVQTDEPGYSKLRAALRKEDYAEAKRQLDALRKTRTDAVIQKAMALWLRRGYTGVPKAERGFWASLTDKEMQLYDKAQEQKQMLFERFRDWYWQLPD